MSTKPTTLKEFQKRFPNDDVCLEHLMRVRYGNRLVCSNCQVEGTFYRVKARRCFECEHCGYQVYPTAGTPFENTRTPLTDWFFVMFLFTASRNGVAAKEVERPLQIPARQPSPQKAIKPLFGVRMRFIWEFAFCHG